MENVIELLFLVLMMNLEAMREIIISLKRVCITENDVKG